MLYHRKRRPAFSLLEAILAAFILLVAIALCVYVFDASLQLEASNEKRVRAALVADSVLAEIRDAANLSYQTVASTYTRSNWSLPEFPGFRIDTEIRDAKLAVPCTEVEEQYDETNVFPDPSGRYLNKSALIAEVTVSWAVGHSNQIRTLEYVTNFTPASSFRVEIERASGALPALALPVARNATEDFVARAFVGSGSGSEVEEIQFTWYVKPLKGFGSIDTVSRDGRSCRYRNAFRNYKNQARFSPGLCELVVRATYQGRLAESTLRIDNQDV